MQRVGVEAIVAGLRSFLGDMGKVDKSIKDLIPGSNLLSRAFEGVGSVVEWLTGSVFRVLEHALGEILADAFQWAASKAMELVESAIELGGELQSLKIRLDNLNFVAMTDAEREAADAMELVNQKTQEQIDWIQKLNLRSPFTTEDISTVYGMARSYGFADEEARGFVETMADWTAGMDLGGDAMKSVIRQFGQMRNKGKIMQQDLNALAEGGMVPVNNILDIMREKTGLTGSAFDDFKKSGEGVEMFIQTFTEFVGNNFANAAEKANRTFKNATNTFKDMLATFMAKGITLPLLDILGEKIASVNDAFMVINDDIQAGFDRIGTVIGNIVTGLFDLGGGAEGMADSFLAAVEGVADWLETHQGDIQKWLEDGIAWIRNVAIPKVMEFKDFLFGTDERKGAIQKFGDWAQNTLFPFLQQQILPVLQDISDLIFGAKEDSDLATSINEINGTPLQNVLYIIMSLKPLLEPLRELFGAIGEVILTAFGGEEPQTFSEFVTNTLVPAIQDLTKFVSENKDMLAFMLRGLLAFSVIGTVAAWIVMLTLKILAFLAAIGGAALIIAIVAGVVLAFNILKNNITTVVNIILLLIEHLKTRFTDWKNNWTQTINDVVTAFKNKDWAGIGKAIIDGLIRGVQNNISQVYSLFTGIATQIINNFKANLGIHSPSEIFENFGERTVQGFAEGITNAVGMAKKAMSQVTGATLSIGAMAPARLAGAMAPGTVSNNTTNNLTLNMQSSAPTENVIADFEMMRSMVS